VQTPFELSGRGESLWGPQTLIRSNAAGRQALLCNAEFVVFVQAFHGAASGAEMPSGVSERDLARIDLLRTGK
jgi:hypothetical protein